ncbi:MULTISPECIES: ABC transporter permease [Streptomyces]|uniref:ABC transporter permease n=1 Tax=Streptomyces tricolor TaxID=68277 RepID=A0ABS9JAF6_9ACTN|nr:MULTISPECIES: ABC transporter permease [Streptomyces]MCG0062543.1 ABC transporter permease [Streptomyces tricolor]MYU29814.1 ABC transporter permease subunit [Streptomyces sp. SID7810]BCM69255.1 putative peptide ABC transporter permease protein [Streptomyces sp. EAS-AB2608]CUW30872.1 Glutathione transport system permease protein GsiC [Streptomyces reticuli]
MFRFLVRRILGAAVILLIISALVFVLFYAAPRDPARIACGKVCTPETLELVRKNLAISDPLPVQYWEWLKGLFVGRDYSSFGHCNAPCLGYSFQSREPVLDTILDRFPTTISLSLGAAVVFLTFGVGTGMLAAVKQGKALDKIASSASLIASSMQIYVVGVFATYLLVDQLHLLDRASYTPFTDNPGKWFSGLLVPWLVLSLIFTANYTRMTRSQMVESLSQDYVRTARAKGLSSRTVFFRFAWRGAMGPIVTIFGLDLGVLLGGAIITESTFSLQGLGMLSVKAVQNNDLPMLLGVVLVAAGAIVVFNIIVDTVYALIDPRVRLA